MFYQDLNKTQKCFCGHLSSMKVGDTDPPFLMRNITYPVMIESLWWKLHRLIALFPPRWKLNSTG